MKKKRTLKILVVAPHPDDDLIGCGGSMAKHLKNGNEVFVIYVTLGDPECPKFKPVEFTKLRKQETLNAAKVIGLKEEYLFFLEEKVWRLKKERVLFKLLELVRQIQPDICYIPRAIDPHRDHRIVNHLALDAIDKAPSKWFSSAEHECRKTPTILAYHVESPFQRPNYKENITDFLEIKIRALKEHKTQNVKAYERRFRGVNAFYGPEETKPCAEAFNILQISDIFLWKNKD